VPAAGGLRENADDASGIQTVASWMQVSVCNWHRVIMFISCSGLERIGTEYHILFAAAAVGIVFTVLWVWIICSSTGFVCAQFMAIKCNIVIS